MHGEAYAMPYGYSSQAPTVEVQPPVEIQPPHPEAASTEKPLADQPELIETLQKGDYEPTPTVEQRRFSAPMADWDASRLVCTALRGPRS